MTYAAAPPAGGAETTQVIGVTLAALVLTGALLFYGHGHRSGRSGALGYAARLSGRLSGFPGWAAFPAALATASLGIAGLGLYWDVALHTAQGRDAGPLANPSHYLILAGLFGIFSAGWAAIVLPRKRPGPAAVRLSGDWYAPVGGLLLAAAASFALIGFPLDDFWHRLFGQDVTLWGPTHLMLIGGGAMTLVRITIIQVEVRRAVRQSGLPDREYGWVRHLRHVWLPGGLLVGLSTFQGEYDF